MLFFIKALILLLMSLTNHQPDFSRTNTPSLPIVAGLQDDSIIDQAICAPFITTIPQQGTQTSSSSTFSSPLPQPHIRQSTRN